MIIPLVGTDGKRKTKRKKSPQMNHKLHAQNCLERGNVHVTVKHWVSHRAQSPQVTELELQETRDNHI